MGNQFVNQDAKLKLSDPDFLAKCKQQYEECGVFDFEQLVDGEKFQQHMFDFYLALEGILEDKSVLTHKECGTKERTDVTNGFSFYRIRLKSGNISCENRPKLIELYKKFALVELANEINQLASPLLEYITSAKQKLVNIGCFIYEEGDYIGIHNDRHRGSHINFQLPVNINTIGAFRYMQDDLMKVHYDKFCGAKVMNADIWHDVPPVLRIDPNKKPLRIVYMLEYRI